MLRNPSVYTYSSARQSEALTWRRIAEAALQRANLCEAAGGDAASLGKLAPSHFTDSYLLAELQKIDKRFHARMREIADTSPPFIGPLEIEGLMGWLNTHTNTTGPGPSSPPSTPEGEVQLCPE